MFSTQKIWQHSNLLKSPHPPHPPHPPPPPSPPPPPLPPPPLLNAMSGRLLVFLGFEKTGSNTLAKAFELRAQGRASSRSRPSTPNDCDGQAYLCRQNLAQPGCCAREPNGSVVLDDHYGLCERYAATRECRYLTLLRSPLERAVSAYNYFCVACAQGNAHCTSGPNACPNVGISEYVSWFVSTGKITLYVRGLGLSLEAYPPHHQHVVVVRHNRSEPPMSNDDRLAAYYKRARTRLEEARNLFALPLELLDAPAVEARLLRDLDDGSSKATAAWAQMLSMHQNSFNETKAWDRRGSRAGTQEQLRSVASLTSVERAKIIWALRHDVRLYELVQRRATATLARL